MDTTTQLTHISLCAGYGGIDLGLKRAIPGLRTIAASEIEGFACANLVAKMEAGLMDAAPIWSNLKTFPWESFRDRVDILSGGYPCQPFSAVGKRLGTDDPRHLWPFIADGIRLMQPRVCFFENVEGHISLGLRAVIEELGSMGYQVSWGIFSASEVGAPHQRKRVYILADRDHKGSQGHAGDELLLNESRWIEAGEDGFASDAGVLGACWPSRPGEPQHEWEPPRVVGNCDSRGRSIIGEPQSEGEQRSLRNIADGWGGEKSAVGFSKSGNQGGDSLQLRSGKAQHRGASGSINTGGRQAQPPLGGDADGTAGGLDHAELYVTCDNRTDELRLLGNGVVPATATLAFLTLMKRFA